jgi:hypothetical protein
MNPASDPAAAVVPRVAVVAVHGIADQRPGETGQAVAAQLAAACQGQVHAHELMLTVPPLDPALPFRRWEPAAWVQRAWKSLRQSWRSDFLDPALGAAPGAAQHRNSARAPSAPAAQAQASAQSPTPAQRQAEPPSEPPSEPRADLGVRFTDYLLAKAHSVRQGQPAVPANPTPVSVHAVRAPGVHADVFEMYWADLSRLPGSVTSIVAELFTLLFNLSRLGLDALSLQNHLNGPTELRAVTGLYRSADWLLSRVLSLLALQLILCGLVLAGALLLHAHPQGSLWVVSAGLGLISASAFVFWLQWSWLKALLVGAGLAVCAWFWFGSRWGYLSMMLLWLVLWGRIYLAHLAFCDRRFKAVWGLGLVMGALTLSCGWVAGREAGLLSVQGWLDAAMGALEAVLLAHALLWAAMAMLMALTVPASEWALRRGRQHGRDHSTLLVTARLGLFTSVGAFAVFLMLGFNLMSWALQGMFDGLMYWPWWFDKEAPQTACAFLQARADRTAGSFSLVAVALLGLVGFVALVFTPSVLREVRLVQVGNAEGLGLWLSSGYRAIDRLVRVWGWLVAPAAALMALALVAAQVDRLGFVVTVPWLESLIQGSDQGVQSVSSKWLYGLSFAIAGTAAGLMALGKVAVKQLQGLRAPLDAVLDVDNHFREFPRHRISRVHIVERYVALLDHLRQQGFDRVVFVAHSQGTVITAELLRYVQQWHLLGDPSAVVDPSQTPAAPLGQKESQVSVPTLRRWLDAVQPCLLTMGSPLRQLYALRFPALYAWPVNDIQDRSHPGWTGPRPSELGLRHWSNLWASGDYVGRWLWAAPGPRTPQPLEVDDMRYSGDVHRGCDAQGATWRDACLGLDAHTHYFDVDKADVRAELLALVVKAD